MLPHEVLGVRPGASRREVTAAFRRFALRHHPDRGGDPSTFEVGVDAYRRLVAGRSGATTVTAPSRPRADVVFHHRRRLAGDIPSLLRTAGRRVARSLSRS